MYNNRLWDKTAHGKKEHLMIYPTLGRYKSSEFIRVIKKWVNYSKQIQVLKTDLWEESCGDDHTLRSFA